MNEQTIEGNTQSLQTIRFEGQLPGEGLAIALIDLYKFNMELLKPFPALLEKQLTMELETQQTIHLALTPLRWLAAQIGGIAPIAPTEPISPKG